MASKRFTYLRYNAELSEKGLAALGCGDINCEDVQQLDSVEHIDKLKRVGQAVAKFKVSAEHFKGFV